MIKNFSKNLKKHRFYILSEPHKHQSFYYTHATGKLKLFCFAFHRLSSSDMTKDRQSVNLYLFIFLNIKKMKPSLHSRNHVTSGGVYLRGIAHRQHSSEETLLRLRAVGDTVSYFADPRIKPQTSRVDSGVFNSYNSRLVTKLQFQF